MTTTNPLSPIPPNPAFIPNDELRQLVYQIIHQDSVEPFARRMVVLLDSLKAGQTNKLARIARQSANPAYAKLMSTLSDAAREGEFVAAHITVILAAGYAYQETRAYYYDLMNYLDRFREDANTRG